MANGILSIIANIGGVSHAKTIAKAGDHPNVYGDGSSEIVLAAGVAISSWTKGGGNCTIALPTGHGLSSGYMDIYWDSGTSVRYHCNVTVAGDTATCTDSAGFGDAFPSTGETGMVICPIQTINTQIDGDKMSLFGILATRRAHAVFMDSGGIDAQSQHFKLPANELYYWFSGSGVGNPLSGNPIVQCYVSNGETSAGIITIMSLEDSTP